MAENKTIARPYARAVFSMAQQSQQVAEWNAVLVLLAQIIAEANVKSLVEDPKISDQQVITLIAELVAQVYTEQAHALGELLHNFIALLCSSRRLFVLPEIVEVYQALVAESEKQIRASVYSATELDEQQQQRIANALQQRFNSKVDIQYQIDESLLGGVMIRSGNWVMDGSVKGKLARLAETLS